MNYVKMYLIALIVFVIIDGFWLLVISKNLYQKEIGHLLSSNPNILAAVLFYLLFLIGLVYFVINPGVDKESIKTIIISGILFGLITYATYDLTNLATLKEWPLKITIIDLIWGSTISCLVSVITYYVYMFIK